MKRMAFWATMALVAVIVMNSCKDDPVKPKDKESSIKLVSYDETVEGSSTTNEFSAYAVLQNISDSEKEIMIKMEYAEKTMGHDVLFCALENCWQPDEYGVVTAGPRTFGAGEIEKEKDFHVTLSPNNTPGNTKLKFTAYVKDDTTDNKVFYITFKVGL